MNANKNKKFLIVYFVIILLSNIYSIIQIFLIPSDPKNAIFLGYSLSRWLLIGGEVFLLILLSTFFYFQFKNNQRKNIFRFGTVLLRKYTWLTVTGLFIFTSLGLSPVYRFHRFAAYFERINPLLDLTVVILLLYFLFSWVSDLSQPPKKIFDKKTLLFSGLILGFLIVAWVIVAFTGIGLEVDFKYWGGAATPVLFSTIILAGYFTFSIWRLKLKFKNRPVINIIIPMLIYLTTIILWISEPFSASFFAPVPVAPNYEYYPYSDSHYYAMTAQSLLVGEGYLNRGVVQRPIYGFILYIFHLIAGQDYLSVIDLQVVLFAVFPVFIYFLGKRLVNQNFGVFVGISAMIREITAYRSTPLIEVVHSKIFMTDFLAAIFALLIVYLLTEYLSSSHKTSGQLILLGFMMGLGILVRLNIIFFIPPIVFYLLISKTVIIKKKVTSIFVFGLSIFIILVPWMTRNYVYLGEFGIDNSKIRMVIDTRFGQEQNSEEIESTEPVKPDLTLIPVQNSPLNQIGEILLFTTKHFIHNEIHSILILPNTIQFVDLSHLIAENEYFLETWEGSVSAQVVISVIINLIILSFGISIAFKYRGWSGLIPLFFHLFYNLSNGMGRVSGWRYVLVTDWVIYFYYLLAIYYLISKIFYQNKNNGEEIWVVEEKKSNKTWLYWIFNGISLLFAFSMLIPEMFVQPKLAGEISCEEVLRIYPELGAEIGDLIEDQCNEPDQVVLVEKAVYPRYYGANQGEPGVTIPWYEGADYNRLGFSIIGPENSGVIISLKNSPNKFTNYQDVIIIGRWNYSYPPAPYIDADLIYLISDKELIASEIQ